jgi:hypothetical protein
MEQEPHVSLVVVKFHQEVARLLQHPGGVRLACAGDEFDSAAADREEGEDVDAAQPDRVDGEEVAGEDRLSLCLQKLRQDWRSRCGAGGRPAFMRMLRTEVAETVMPSFRSSPTIRR